jgi:TRAP-type C4-dicarboxylate transport system permease large subunit
MILFLAGLVAGVWLTLGVIVLAFWFAGEGDLIIQQRKEGEWQ